MEHAIEPTAERLWDDVSARLRETLNETTYATWFGDASAGELSDDTFSLVVPNDFTREWIEGHFLGFVRAAARDALARDVRVTLTVREPGTATGAAGRARGTGSRRRAAGSRATASRCEPEVHVRPLRDRLVEPVRPRCGARGRRGAGAGLQPAVHLRRHGPRQDAPAPGDRAVRQRAHRGARQRGT